LGFDATVLMAAYDGAYGSDALGRSSQIVLMNGERAARQ
jgi:hypothetical protein